MDWSVDPRDAADRQLTTAAGSVVEQLEARTMLSSHRHAHTVSLYSGAVIRAGAGQASALQVRHFYGLDQLGSSAFPLYTNSGEFQTIAIVGAPAAFINDVIPTRPKGNMSDFASQEGVPKGSDVIIDDSLVGGTGLDPFGDPTLATDTYGALLTIAELEWARAIAPGANLILIDVPSTNGVVSSTDMAAGVTEAVRMIHSLGDANTGPVNQENHGGVVMTGLVSNGEDATTAAMFDSLFGYKYNRDISFIAAAGDRGGTVNTPSTSPWVTSVGSTEFAIDATGNRQTEVASLISSGGRSAVEPVPAFQKGLKVGSKKLASRSSPDLSIIGQGTGGGLNAYYTPDAADSLPPKEFNVSGDTIGAAIFAGMVADANELRRTLGEPEVGRDLNNVLYTLYNQNAANYFTDIVAGNNTAFYAGKGFDLATGMGSPNGLNLIPGLAGTFGILSTAVSLRSQVILPFTTSTQTGQLIFNDSSTKFGTAQVSPQFVTVFGQAPVVTLPAGQDGITDVQIQPTSALARTADGKVNGTGTATVSVTIAGQTTTTVYTVAITGTATVSKGRPHVNLQVFSVDPITGKRLTPGMQAVFTATISS